MFKSCICFYSVRRMPVVLAYMLQNTEYEVGPYLKWFWRISRFDKVLYRRKLVPTKPARLILWTLRLGMLAQIAVGIALLVLWYSRNFESGLTFGLALLIAYPLVWTYLAVLPMELGRLLIIRPRQARAIHASKAIFAKFKGEKIAVAGSYGKTSMKELLLTILSEGKKVAATPANKNVSISHAIFASKLKGDEDVLIIEYGEYGPGDVARFASITQPTRAVITGVAPAHIDKYGTLERAAHDIFSVSDVLPADKVYVNGESADALAFVRPGQQLYSEKNALGWQIRAVKVGLDGTHFEMHKGSETLKLHTALLGRHQVGPVALAAALARELGLTKKQIEAGVSKTAPFEHRMQPYGLAGAIILDDTYNGNIEGIRAGTRLLAEIPANRKIYVTPGLVDQGETSADVHEEMGRLIANAKPDLVVLMKHSTTKDIERGLQSANFSGKITIEDDPLHFYTNLNLVVAKGDVVMLQNDWPDNYN